MNKPTKYQFLHILTCVFLAVSIASCSKTTGPTPEVIATEAKPAARIAFSSGPNGNFEIFIMNQDGSGITQITNDPANDTNPVWSNDGKKIAFVSDRDGTQKIYVMGADGSNQVRLTSGSGIEFGANWSPDDQRIIFTSFQDGNSDIYVINVDGTNMIRLTQNFASEVSSQWSPDGKKILYSSEVDGNYEVFVANADGSEPVNLTNNPARDTCPVWSPDGQMISFNSDRSGKEAIYSMNSDGSAPTMLTTSDGYISCTDWSQDGKKLIFNMQVNGQSKIYVMDPDGRNLTPVSGGVAYDYDPNWSPGVTILTVARAVSPTTKPVVISSSTLMAAASQAPAGKPRSINIAFVISAEAQSQYSDLISSYQGGIDKDLTDRKISVTWKTITADDESLRSLQTKPNEYDIVILALGQPPVDTSKILRDWMTSGGIIWAFDNGTFSTWRNKDLFGGLLPGADLSWESPEEVQVKVQGLNVLPYDETSSLAWGVKGDLAVTGNVTISQDSETKIIYANLTRFDRSLDASTTPLLKAQKVGEAVIGGPSPQPGEWVVVGAAKRIEEGQFVVLPFLALDLAPVQQFESNLIEWCLDQVGKTGS